MEQQPCHAKRYATQLVRQAAAGIQAPGMGLRGSEPVSSRPRLRGRADQGLPCDADRVAQCLDIRVPTVRTGLFRSRLGAGPSRGLRPPGSGELARKPRKEFFEAPLMTVVSVLDEAGRWWPIQLGRPPRAGFLEPALGKRIVRCPRCGEKNSLPELLMDISATCMACARRSSCRPAPDACVLRT